VPAALPRLGHPLELCHPPASHDDYEDNVLPSGSPTGTAEAALDCARGLYLNDPTIWPQPDTPPN
jgi:hypothetical protein